MSNPPHLDLGDLGCLVVKTMSIGSASEIATVPQAQDLTAASAEPTAVLCIRTNTIQPQLGTFIKTKDSHSFVHLSKLTHMLQHLDLHKWTVPQDKDFQLIWRCSCLSRSIWQTCLDVLCILKDDQSKFGSYLNHSNPQQRRLMAVAHI